jgi:DNA-directed RNA polymerase specialized sigma subunit
MTTPNIVPTIAPKIDREAIYQTWKSSPTPEALSGVINAYTGLLHSELPKYTSGNLPPDTIKGLGKKIIKDSLQTYDPKKGSLANHIVVNLQKLHRINYETSSFFRMSEEMQRGTSLYRSTKNDLQQRLLREPSREEMSEALGWTPAKVGRMDKMLMKESLTENLGYSPAYVNMDDPKIDYLYHDLSPEDKIVFQYKTGYRGAPILKLKDIAKRLNMSIPAVSVRAANIAKTLNKLYGAE